MLIVPCVSSHGCLHFNTNDINYDECWLYVGPAYWSKGYPIINRHNKNWIVSRFIWYILTGRDYRGKEVHHKCHTRACINPFHLEELTSKRHRRYHNGKRRATVVE